MIYRQVEMYVDLEGVLTGTKYGTTPQARRGEVEDSAKVREVSGTDVWYRALSQVSLTSITNDI